eukprot:1195302-Prorocentrum_minimum.AAC.10
MEDSASEKTRFCALWCTSSQLHLAVADGDAQLLLQDRLGGVTGEAQRPCACARGGQGKVPLPVPKRRKSDRSTGENSSSTSHSHGSRSHPSGKPRRLMLLFSMSKGMSGKPTTASSSSVGQ